MGPHALPAPRPDDETVHGGAGPEDETVHGGNASTTDGLLGVPDGAPSIQRIATSSMSRAGENPITHARAFLAHKGEDKVMSGVVNLGGAESVIHGVFDGHGGVRAADYCANNMVAALQAAYQDTTAYSHVERLSQALVSAFTALHEAVALRTKGTGDGTTATVVVVDSEHIVTANVGDSSAYVYTSDRGMAELTFDHRLDRNDAERARCVEAGAAIGRIQRADGTAVGPMRLFPGGLTVTRSIGDTDSTPAAIPEPEVRVTETPVTGCTVVLATDGVWDYIGLPQVEKHLAASVKSNWRLSKLASAIIKTARERNVEADDATVVCVRVPDAQPTPPDSASDSGTGVGRLLAAPVKRMLKLG